MIETNLKILQKQETSIKTSNILGALLYLLSFAYATEDSTGMSIEEYKNNLYAGVSSVFKLNFYFDAYRRIHPNNQATEKKQFLKMIQIKKEEDLAVVDMHEYYLYQISYSLEKLLKIKQILSKIKSLYCKKLSIRYISLDTKECIISLLEKVSCDILDLTFNDSYIESITDSTKYHLAINGMLKDGDPARYNPNPHMWNEGRPIKRKKDHKSRKILIWVSFVNINDFEEVIEYLCNDTVTRMDFMLFSYRLLNSISKLNCGKEYILNIKNTSKSALTSKELLCFSSLPEGCNMFYLTSGIYPYQIDAESLYDFMAKQKSFSELRIDWIYWMAIIEEFRARKKDPPIKTNVMYIKKSLYESSIFFSKKQKVPFIKINSIYMPLRSNVPCNRLEYLENRYKNTVFPNYGIFCKDYRIHYETSRTDGNDTDILFQRIGAVKHGFPKNSYYCIGKYIPRTQHSPIQIDLQKLRKYLKEESSPPYKLCQSIYYKEITIHNTENATVVHSWKDKKELKEAFSYIINALGNIRTDHLIIRDVLYSDRIQLTDVDLQYVHSIHAPKICLFNVAKEVLHALLTNYRYTDPNTTLELYNINFFDPALFDRLLEDRNKNISMLAVGIEYSSDLDIERKDFTKQKRNIWKDIEEYIEKTVFIDIKKYLGMSIKNRKELLHKKEIFHILWPLKYIRAIRENEEEYVPVRKKVKFLPKRGRGLKVHLVFQEAQNTLIEEKSIHNFLVWIKRNVSGASVLIIKNIYMTEEQYVRCWLRFSAWQEEFSLAQISLASVRIKQERVTSIWNACQLEENLLLWNSIQEKNIDPTLLVLTKEDIYKLFDQSIEFMQQLDRVVGPTNTQNSSGPIKLCIWGIKHDLEEHVRIMKEKKEKEEKKGEDEYSQAICPMCRISIDDPMDKGLWCILPCAHYTHVECAGTYALHKKKIECSFCRRENKLLRIVVLSHKEAEAVAGSSSRNVRSIWKVLDRNQKWSVRNDLKSLFPAQ